MVIVSSAHNITQMDCNCIIKISVDSISRLTRSDCEYDVMCLTETWLSDDVSSSELFSANYIVYRCDRRFDIVNAETIYICNSGRGCSHGSSTPFSCLVASLMHSALPSVDIVSLKWCVANSKNPLVPLVCTCHLS